VSESAVYWTAGSNVRRVSKDGGDPVTVASSSIGSTDRVGVTATHVYFTVSLNWLLIAPIGGGEAQQLYPITGGFAIGPSGVFFGQNTGKIFKMPLGGGALTEISDSDKGSNGLRRVCVDGSSVYWTSPQAQGGFVEKAPLSGGDPVELADGGRQNGLALDASSLYWASPEDDGIYKVAIGGGSVTTLATGQPDPTAVAVDGAFVYWTNSAGGTVMKVPKGGGSVVTVASGQDKPVDLAVDSEGVYWVTGGAVMKLAK
jgi:sugar lactone lactonase YvrE